MDCFRIRESYQKKSQYHKNRNPENERNHSSPFFQYPYTHLVPFREQS